MKKILLIICLLFLCSCKKNVSLNKDTFDYGAKVDIKNITDKKYKCQSKVLNTLKLGKHNDTMFCNKKEYKIKYEVIDKEKPIIWIGNTITRTPGYKEDISKELTCMDNADRTPLTNITGSYDINTVGTYNLTFTCTDNSGNSSSKDFKLVVKEKNVTTGGAYTGVLTNYLDFKDVYKERKNDNTLVGIDVSKYQGNIDWQKVKDAGVEFAIIRLGYRYFYDEPLSLDPYFLKNIEGASNAFLKTIKDAGYTPVHYASKSYLEYIWLPVDYDIWLAHYTKQTSYKGDYVMWQLSSNGKVDGINNYVDINVYYKN